MGEVRFLNMDGLKISPLSELVRRKESARGDAWSCASGRMGPILQQAFGVNVKANIFEREGKKESLSRKANKRKKERERELC